MEDESACTACKEGLACSNALLVWRFDARTVEIETSGAESTDAAIGAEPEASIAAAAEDPDGHVLPDGNGHGADACDQGAILTQDAQTSAEIGATAEDRDAARTASVD